MSEKKIVCPCCSRVIDGNSRFCEYCGHTIEKFYCSICGKELQGSKGVCDECKSKIAKSYCPYCNQVVDSNYRFCKYCGRTIEKNLVPPKRKSCFTQFLIFCLVVALIIFCFVKCTDTAGSNNDGEKELLSRSARNSDIVVVSSEELSFSDTYKIVPDCDIDNLQLTFSWKDENKNVLATKVKSVGNVKEGIEYTVSFSLSEFSLSDIAKIKYYSCTVIGGTVSYFA